MLACTPNTPLLARPGRLSALWRPTDEERLVDEALLLVQHGCVDEHPGMHVERLRARVKFKTKNGHDEHRKQG